MKIEIETLGVRGVYNPNLLNPAEVILGCPICHYDLTIGKESDCPRCGTPIDWSEEE